MAVGRDPRLASQVAEPVTSVRTVTNLQTEWLLRVAVAVRMTPSEAAVGTVVNLPVMLDGLKTLMRRARELVGCLCAGVLEVLPLFTMATVVMVHSVLVVTRGYREESPLVQAAVAVCMEVEARAEEAAEVGQATPSTLPVSPLTASPQSVATEEW